MIRQHNAIAQANLPLPEVPGLAEHQAAEAEVSKFIRSTGPTFKPLEHVVHTDYLKKNMIVHRRRGQLNEPQTKCLNPTVSLWQK